MTAERRNVLPLLALHLRRVLYFSSTFRKIVTCNTFVVPNCVNLAVLCSCNRDTIHSHYVNSQVRRGEGERVTGWCDIMASFSVKPFR